MGTIDITIGRFLHIIAGVGWVGVGFTLVFILHPLVKTMGQQGQIMLGRIYAKSKVGMWMPIFAIVTTVAGLYIYGRWMMETSGRIGSLSDTGFWVLTVGVGFGLLAFGHGIATMGKATRQMGAAVEAIEGTPTDEQQTAIDAAQKYLFLHSNISFGLAGVALALMSVARYL